jgi:hypothetical protein
MNIIYYYNIKMPVVKFQHKDKNCQCGCRKENKKIAIADDKFDEDKIFADRRDQILKRRENRGFDANKPKRYYSFQENKTPLKEEDLK